MKEYLYQDLYDQEEKHWWHLAKRELVINLIKNYFRKRQAKILDIGCGTGKNMEAFSKFGLIWGIDISEEAIRFCKKRGINKVRIANSERSKIKSESFDLITILDVLEHTDDKKSLKEIYRILRKKGLLILTVPAFQWLWGHWDKVLHHNKRYYKKELESLLKSQGFVILKISYIFSFLVLPALIIRFIKSKLYAKNYPSDFQLQLPLLSSFFTILSNVEGFLLKKSSIPFGTSIVCVARKN